jgi:hypothetical protein
VTKTKKDYVSLRQLAEEAKMSRATLYAHAHKGHITLRKVGYFTFVTKADAADFLSKIQHIELGDRKMTIYQPEVV